ncbi:MAG: glycine--tRNA ligase subunit beta [Candidatus Wallbacteria bacterium]|nr:glycine--tRNA ligase subunit beta [Candidatus Wallbacteria bacterium]
MEKLNSVLEIGCEEMPCGFLKKLDEDLPGFLSEELPRFHLAAEKTDFHLTPRRIIILLRSVARTHSELSATFRGPRATQAFHDGKPTKALEGFVRSKNCSISDVRVDGEYVFIDKCEQVAELEQLLSEFYRAVSSRIHQPKSMFWQDRRWRFIRPVRWVMAFFGSCPLPVEIMGVASGKYSYGSRFGDGSKFEVSGADAFIGQLLEHGVVSDHRERIRQIGDQVAQLGGQVDDELVRENAFLVEAVHVFAEKMPVKFLDLPESVLVTVMNKQQRYFPCSFNGRLTPEFVVVASRPVTEQIREGNRRVLIARLSDADFFYREDLALDLRSKTAGLSGIVFHRQLGTMEQKAARMAVIADLVGKQAYPEFRPPISWEEITPLLKVDMLTDMVFEFPELQGRMGEIYLAAAGYPYDIAAAAREHYLPAGQQEHFPRTVCGTVCSIADKMDTLTAFFAAGIMPTGSKDPFALRRMALGLLRTLIEKKISVSLPAIMDCAFQALVSGQGNDKGLEHPGVRLPAFFKDRFYFMLKERYPYDLIEAVCQAGFEDPYDSFLRVQALTELSRREEFRAFTLLALRIENILKGDRTDGRNFDRSLLREPDEIRLHEFYENQSSMVADKIAGKDYLHAMEGLLAFAPHIDAFFNTVLVNCPEEDLRINRRLLLDNLHRMFLQLFDIGHIASKNERSQ